MSSLSRGTNTSTSPENLPQDDATRSPVQDLAAKSGESLRLLADYIRRDASTASDLYLVRSNTSHDGE